LEGLGQYARALADWDRAIELDQGPQRAWFRANRAAVLGHCGEHARTAAEAEQVASANDLPNDTWYDLARAGALASGAVRQDDNVAPGEREKLAELYATRAVDWLTRAARAGLFRAPAYVQRLRTNKDLDALRSRDDFRKLLAEVERQAGAGKP